MNRGDLRPSLFEGVGVALVAGITAAVIFPIMTTLFTPAAVLRLLIAGLSLAYLIYLLRRSRQKLGQLTVMAGWGLVAIVSWFFAPSLLSYAAIHLLMIWLVRSLYFYNSLLSALADLGLTGLALMAAIWGWFSSGSLFLVFWCLFLVQALFVTIPRHFAQPTKKASSASEPGQEDPFEKAHASAQQALRKLFSTP